ncbi:hypothetical protein KSP35_19685 [Aquihabitans sp. G128]|uniref:hypothetical protein n=1 Tax=Aquihabitans sp. G128 TaxID=2849779 RepID=UPI001C212D1E|nr:hypothetical protein [Aquihabitans sp. G128]QXC60521.1 hypothetical protein KSP35_19685 [Aquihabitans sp. G128]
MKILMAVADALHDGAGGILVDIGDDEQLARSIPAVRSDFIAALARSQHVEATACHQPIVQRTGDPTTDVWAAPEPLHGGAGRSTANLLASLTPSSWRECDVAADRHGGRVRLTTDQVRAACGAEGGIMSNDRGVPTPTKILRVLGEGEQLEYAANGHEVTATWGLRRSSPGFVLVTNHRLVVVGKPPLMGKVPVDASIPWADGRRVSGEPDGGWIRVDLETVDGVLSICTPATAAYEIETRSRSHIVDARNGHAR